MSHIWDNPAFRSTLQKHPVNILRRILTVNLYVKKCVLRGQFRIYLQLNGLQLHTSLAELQPGTVNILKEPEGTLENKASNASKRSGFGF